MRLANRTKNLIAFRFKLPSQRIFRLEIKGDEVVDLSNAVKVSLEGHAYFEELVNSGKLEIIEPKPQAKEAPSDGASTDTGN